MCLPLGTAHIVVMVGVAHQCCPGKVQGEPCAREHLAEEPATEVFIFWRTPNGHLQTVYISIPASEPSLSFIEPSLSLSLSDTGSSEVGFNMQKMQSGKGQECVVISGCGRERSGHQGPWTSVILIENTVARCHCPLPVRCIFLPVWGYSSFSKQFPV
jgi:hypothetical protein